MESLINIKSLENFKSYFLVNVFPFRFVANKNLEILLYRRQNTEEFQAFSDYRSKLDPTTFFTAARILYQSIHNEKIILDAKKENWVDPLFLKILGLICNSYETHSSESHQSFFIEESLWNNHCEKKNSDFQWFPIEEIISQPYLFSQDFLNYFSSFNMKDHLEYPNKKIYGIIDCESDVSFDNIFEALYQGYLQKEHEIWVSFNVAKGDFPKERDLNNIVGWVVSGSDFATYDTNLLWLNDLFKLLNDIYRVKGKNSKILGICFGHQAIAKAFGGEVEKMPSNRLLLNKQKIYWDHKFLGKKYVKKSQIIVDLLQKNDIFLNQYHGDHVSKLPTNAEIFAFSDNTEIEAFGIDDNILGIQAHPEFDDTFMIYKFNYESNDETLLEGYTKLKLHNKEIMLVCREFLNVNL